ncbi:hypothetical protein LMG27952_05826 [Paraburkholderia hiiakae]|uniref:Uncharacterized protein n=1 Tax=Paraburkholderia hiiakae TaxID=1081782 RepID=A0ABM8P3J9_9BURK|nr:hypothetical protein LMG27952_05826 [Paraburkholderia hiiakae]
MFSDDSLIVVHAWAGWLFGILSDWGILGCHVYASIKLRIK